MSELVGTSNGIVSYFVVYARWLIGGILLFAGITKARDLDSFITTIELFRLIPQRLSAGTAHLIVMLELMVGLSVTLGIVVYPTTLAAFMLFCVFTLAIGVNLMRRSQFACNCFGTYFKEQISEKTLLRNCFFALLCLLILKFYDGYFALEAWVSGKSVASDNSIRTFFLLTAVLIVTGVIGLSAQTILKTLTSSGGENT